MAGPDRIYWDTCCFISWLNDEERPQADKDGLNACALAFFKKDIILVTSAITYAEVTATKVSAEGLKKFSDFLKRSDVDAPPPDVGIAERAREIRDHFNAKLNHIDAVTVPDSLHLATAIIYKVREFHTFDENPDKKKRPGLIQLTGDPALNGLTICKPNRPQREMNV